MSRRHSAEKREVNPDPKFGNIIITKFMNSIMYDGKKSAAESIVYGALELIETKTKQGPLPVRFASLCAFSVARTFYSCCVGAECCMCSANYLAGV